MKHSVTSACIAASKAVSRPMMHGTSWTVYYTEPDQNATRSVNADTCLSESFSSKSCAVRTACLLKAQIALGLLLGKSWVPAMDDFHELISPTGGDWRHWVRALWEDICQEQLL